MEWPIEDWIDPVGAIEEWYDEEGTLVLALVNEARLLQTTSDVSNHDMFNQLDQIRSEAVGVDLETIFMRSTPTKDALHWLEEFCRRVKIFGKLSPYSLAALSLFGTSLRVGGDFSPAVDTHRLVLDFWQSSLRALKARAADKTIHCRVDLAYSLHEMGQTKEELEQWDIVYYSLRHDMFGTTSNESLDTLGYLVELLESLGRVEEAHKLLEEKSSLWQRMRATNVRQSEDYETLARLEFKRGNLGLALGLLVSLFRVKCTEFGNSHPETLEAMRLVAMCEIRIPDYLRKRRCYIAYLAIQYVVKQLEMMYGTEHFSTKAAQLDMEAVVNRCVSTGLDFNFFDNPSLSILKTDLYPEILLLLECGVDPNRPFPLGSPPLNVAARLHKLDVVELLLKKGADPLAPDSDGYNIIVAVLSYLAGEKSLEILRLVLKYIEPDQLAPNSGNYTSLHYAAMRGHTDAVQILLEHGASTVAPTWAGLKAIHFAVSSGNIECVKAITAHVERMAKIRGVEYLRNSFENTKGQSFLSYACQGGRVDVVRRLLAEGSQYTNSTDVLGATPLYYAIAAGRDDVMDLLMSEPDVTTDIILHDGRNLLHVAAASGNVKILDKFLGLDLDICSRDYRGETALSYAAASGSLECIQRVMDRLPLAERNPSSLWSPLHWASRNGDLGVLRFLIQSGFENSSAKTAKNGAWAPWDIAIHSNNLKLLNASKEAAELCPELMIEHGNPGQLIHGTTEPSQGKSEIQCDLCLQSICGSANGCTTCDDFHYCFMCIQTANQTHPGHEWTLIDYEYMVSMLPYFWRPKMESQNAGHE